MRSSVLPRYCFDVHTIDGVVARDATGCDAPDVGSALHGCIGAVLDMIENNEQEVERILVRGKKGDLLLMVNMKALRAEAERS